MRVVAFFGTRTTSWRRSRSPKWKTKGRAAVDRVCLRRAVDRGLSRGATGNVRMTSRQPPNDSVASHGFRIFRPKESFAPRCASDLLPLLLHGLTIEP